MVLRFIRFPAALAMLAVMFFNGVGELASLAAKGISTNEELRELFRRGAKEQPVSACGTAMCPSTLRAQATCVNRPVTIALGSGETSLRVEPWQPDDTPSDRPTLPQQDDLPKSCSFLFLVSSVPLLTVDWRTVTECWSTMRETGCGRTPQPLVPPPRTLFVSP